MKSWVYVFTQSSFASSSGREGQDMALLCASFDHQVTLLFVQEGVLQLRAGQTPERIAQKDYLARLKGLHLFDVDEVWACEHALTKHQLQASDLAVKAVKTATTEQLRTLMAEADHVMVYG
jgi:tRNA 2-thiouridine synthesizing protein C